jgi:phage tail sheath protein FI
MSTASYNHGVRVFDAGVSELPIQAADRSPIGLAVTAPLADEDTFPLDEPVHFYSNDTEKVALLGATGTAKAAIDAINDQGVVASIVMVRVAEGVDIAATLTNMAGNSATQTGVNAFRYARGHTGVEPGILIAPGFTSQRPDAAKNPVMAELEGISSALKAIKIGDCPSTTKEAALAYRADFSDRYTYLVDPAVKLAGAVVAPASARAAALFVKKDKAKGGPYWSPSNQAIGGIVGTARPISFFDGEADHEANYLNENRINTIIPAVTIQGAGGAVSANGTILWGSETTSEDPLWRFINVVRTRAAIEKAIPPAFRSIMDENLSAQLGIAIIRSMQIFLDELTAIGAILGGRAYWLKEMNSSQSLRSGILRIEFDAEEAPPLNDLQFGSRRNSVYFDTLANDILTGLDRAA